MLTVDDFSKFIEIDKLDTLSSQTCIEALKGQFSRHGIPEKLRSDNGTQFSSSGFTSFCRDYGVQHETSSPHYPQSNGAAERAIQTVKRLWSKGADKHLALLDYRTTPLASCGLSPAQLCMSRRPRNLLPIAKDLLRPITLDTDRIRQQLDDCKRRQKVCHDKHSGGDLPPLRPGDAVRLAPRPGTAEWRPGTVVEEHAAPRTYIVESEGRRYRRNRRHLRASTAAANGDQSDASNNDSTRRTSPASDQPDASNNDSAQRTPPDDSAQ